MCRSCDRDFRFVGPMVVIKRLDLLVCGSRLWTGVTVRVEGHTLIVFHSRLSKITTTYHVFIVVGARTHLEMMRLI